MSNAEQTELLARVRSLLPSGLDLREVSMFGGLALLVDEKLLVSAGRTGDLLVRVPKGSDAELLARPEASRPTMGPNKRSMSAGWISIAGDALDDATLEFWIGVARSHRSGCAERLKG